MSAWLLVYPSKEPGRKENIHRVCGCGWRGAFGGRVVISSGSHFPLKSGGEQGEKGWGGGVPISVRAPKNSHIFNHTNKPSNCEPNKEDRCTLAEEN
jgi:hypothetical protein